MKKIKPVKIFLICLASAAVIVLLAVLGDIFGIIRTKKEVNVKINSGASTVMIANELKKSGEIKFPFAFRVYSKLKKYHGKYSFGSYSFSGNESYKEIASELMNNGEKASSVTVTVPEGSDIDLIAGLLSKNGVCTENEFKDEVQNGSFDFDFISHIPVGVHYRLEGYLFPETYDFFTCYSGKENAHLAVQKMLELTDKELKEYASDIQNSKYSLHEILTMASLVELEAGGEQDEMKNVSAVFYNRLNSSAFPTLGSSPTIKYPYGNGAYNTYITSGLPVGPLCSPGKASFVAALNPTKNFGYYYFVTDKSMKFYYTKTINEHNAIIKKLKEEDNWIYE